MLDSGVISFLKKNWLHKEGLHVNKLIEEI